MKLTDITVSAPQELLKLAGIESPDEKQLEQDFANLAFLFIQDRAAQLMPYMLGFEVVEREEDGSKAVGIFGFKVGDDYYYVPAFFVNQQVKGMDLLFSRRGNKFMPLTAEFMDKILDRKALRIGTGAAPDNKLREDFAVPDFDFVRNPPMGTKMAGDKSPWRAGMGHDAWNDIQKRIVSSQQSDPLFRRDFAGALAKLANDRLEGAQYEDTLRGYVSNHGGPVAATGLMRLLGRNIKFANAALEFYGDVASLQVSEFDASLAPVVKKAEVEITTEAYSDMPSEERKRLVTTGIAVSDKRKDEVKSKLYDTDYTVQFSNPSEGGRYELLLVNGSTVDADVRVSAGSCGLTVISANGDVAFTAEPGAVFVRGSKSDEADKLYGKAISLESLEVGKRYMLVDEAGHSSDPFSVRATIAESGSEKNTSYKVYFQSIPDHRRTDSHRSEWTTACSSDCSSYLDRIRVVEDDGRRLRTKGDSLIAPSATWKALELPERRYDSEFKPGNPLDFEENLYKNAIHRLDVIASDSGSTFHIGLNGNVNGPYGVKQALHELVCRYGLGAADADTVMKSAAVGMYNKTRKLIKFAQLAGVNMPIPPYAQEMGTESQMGMPVAGTDTSFTEGQTTGLAVPRDPTVPGFASGGQTEMEVAQLAEQAAASGQKHVFDHATVGGLARLYDTSAALDQYIPEMHKSLDRIGRILFLFYWKNEAFEERFGASDMADMEDRLRSVFKSFGGLVHALEQKSIAAADGNDIQVA